MSNLTNLQRQEYKGKNSKNSCRIQNQLKSRIQSRQKSFRIDNTAWW
jgi:hypothetical protein